jgi:hypothetical protein
MFSPLNNPRTIPIIEDPIKRSSSAWSGETLQSRRALLQSDMASREPQLAAKVQPAAKVQLAAREQPGAR